MKMLSMNPKSVYFFIIFMLVMPPWLIGQWHPHNILSFDPGDTSWSHAISIDTINCRHNIWQVGHPNKTVFTAPISSPNVLVTDTLSPYPASDTSIFVMTFPGHSDSYWWFENVGFQYQLNIDTNAMVKIEYTADSGLTWINLADSLPDGFSSVTPLQTTSGWHYWSLSNSMGPITPLFHNDSMQLRFTFISDSMVSGKDGWMIDDMIVWYGMEGISSANKDNNISIFPNPAANSISIRATSTIYKIAITNLLGQLVHTEEFNSEKVKVDVGNLPKGFYLVRVNDSENLKFTKE